MAKQKKTRKRVLIIVRGAMPAPHFKNKRLEKFRNLLFSKLSAEKGYIEENYRAFADFFKEHYDVVELLNWDGDIIQNPTLSRPIGQLEKSIGKYKYSDVDIIAVSLGGHILEKVFSKRGANKINKILYIGAVHNSKHKIKGANKIINVYSELDEMFKFSNNLIEGFGNFNLKGKNVVNISLKNIKHDELLHNKKLNQKGLIEKSLFELYKNLLLGK